MWTPRGKWSLAWRYGKAHFIFTSSYDSFLRWGSSQSALVIEHTIFWKPTLLSSSFIYAEQVINADGSLAVVSTSEVDYWVVDLKAKRFLKKLSFPEGATPFQKVCFATFSPDGQRLIHYLSKIHEEFRSTRNICYPAVSDLRTGLVSFVYLMGRWYAKVHALVAGMIFSSFSFWGGGVKGYTIFTALLTWCDCCCYRRAASPDGGCIGSA